MSILAALPVLSLAAIVQSAVVSRLPLLGGTADVMLLTILAWTVQDRVTTGWQWAIIGGLILDFLSGMPFGVFTVSYLITTGVTITLRRRVWQYSILVYLLMIILGTVISHLFSLIVVFFRSLEPAILVMLQNITLPSLILNLAISIPVFVLIQELAWLIHPEDKTL